LNQGLDFDILRSSLEFLTTAISKKVGASFVASCILHTKPEMYCGSYVNNEQCLHAHTEENMPASYCEDKVWENSQSPYCCDLSLTPFTLPIVHFGLGMQHATKPSPTFFEIAVYCCC